MSPFSNCLGVPSFARSKPFNEEVSAGLELEGGEEDGVLVEEEEGVEDEGLVEGDELWLFDDDGLLLDELG